MPTEAILALTFVGLLFAVFAVGVTYADIKTREFRE